MSSVYTSGADQKGVFTPEVKGPQTKHYALRALNAKGANFHSVLLFFSLYLGPSLSPKVSNFSRALQDRAASFLAAAISGRIF